MLIYIWVVYNKLYKRHFMPIFSQDCLIYLCICKGCNMVNKKVQKLFFFAACDLYKGHVTLMLHTLMLWVTWIQNFNVVTLLFRDMLQTKLQTHFFQICDFEKGHMTLHDFQLWVISIQSLKYVILIFTDIWSRQYLGPPPDPGKNNNHTVIQLWVKNDTC